MKKVILSLIISLLFCMPSMAGTECFLLKEHNKPIQKEGECETRYSPCSTFKVPLAAIGYDSGILQDEFHPEWPFRENYLAVLDVHKQSHNPTTWMKNSAAWYSQVLTQELGMNKFKVYIKNFHYGNENLVGDKGKNNGLTHAWLSSSLEISPLEQVEFLNKLLNCKLPISAKACDLTKKILFIEDLSDGWKLYGKTGSGDLLNAKRQKTEIQHGWFVGWIEKNNRAIIFTNHIVDDAPQDTFAGPRTRQKTKERLLKLIEQLK